MKRRYFPFANPREIIVDGAGDDENDQHLKDKLGADFAIEEINDKSHEIDRERQSGKEECQRSQPFPDSKSGFRGMRTHVAPQEP